MTQRGGAASWGRGLPGRNFRVELVYGPLEGCAALGNRRMSPGKTRVELDPISVEPLETCSGGSAELGLTISRRLSGTCWGPKSVILRLQQRAPKGW